MGNIFTKSYQAFRNKFTFIKAGFIVFGKIQVYVLVVKKIIDKYICNSFKWSKY